MLKDLISVIVDCNSLYLNHGLPAVSKLHEYRSALRKQDLVTHRNAYKLVDSDLLIFLEVSQCRKDQQYTCSQVAILYLEINLIFPFCEDCGEDFGRLVLFGLVFSFDMNPPTLS